MAFGWLALLVACTGRHLPDHAEAPKPGSLEEQVAELPGGAKVSDWFTHWSDDEKLLLRLVGDNGDESLAVADAADGSVTTYCDDPAGGYDGPVRVRFTEDVGMWDLVDGDLVLRTDDDLIATCGTDGAVSSVSVAHTPWAGTSFMTPEGFGTWIRDAATPTRFRWDDGSQEPLSWTGPLPRRVTQRRDARGVWVVTEAAGALTLWDFDADTLAATEVLTADLGGAVLVDGDDAFYNVEPDSLVVLTDQGVLAASATLGDGFHAVALDGTPAGAGSAYAAWPDGRGFSVWGQGVSANLADDRVVSLGDVTPQGRHIDLSGPVEATVVDVYDNASADPADGPVLTWTADLSTGWDSSDVETEPTFQAFGFENGQCAVARWGNGQGMDGKPSPDHVGAEAWRTADTVLYAGPCDEPLELVTRGLWNDAAAISIPSGPVLKSDRLVFTLTKGEMLYEQADPYDPVEWDTSLEGYALADDGEIVGLFEDADAWTGRRQGTTFWTVHDRTLFRIDASEELR